MTGTGWNPQGGVWLDDCPSTVADPSIKNLIIGGSYGTFDAYPRVGNFTGEIAYVTITGEEIPPASETNNVDLLPLITAPTQDNYTITYKKDVDDVTPDTNKVTIVPADTASAPSTITFDTNAENPVAEDMTFIPETLESKVFTNGGGSIRFELGKIQSGLRMKTSISNTIANAIEEITAESGNS